MKIFFSILSIALLSILPFSGGSVENRSSLLPGIGINSTNSSLFNSNDTVSKGMRNFGPFKVKYGVTKAGYKLDCTLMIGGELVGLSTLTAAAPNYQFNIISNTNKAWGTFTVAYYPPDQVSTLEGDIYVVSANTDTVRFKGTVAGWYTTQQIAPQQ
ncbi:MAG: hypothetical protein JWP12_2532 [Bacteroidetes bacterium]|nr:hypothetical protein [Bacteroidota bacterium]